MLMGGGALIVRDIHVIYTYDPTDLVMSTQNNTTNVICHKNLTRFYTQTNLAMDCTGDLAWIHTLYTPINDSRVIPVLINVLAYT